MQSLRIGEGNKVSREFIGLIRDEVHAWLKKGEWKFLKKDKRIKKREDKKGSEDRGKCECVVWKMKKRESKRLSVESHF